MVTPSSAARWIARMDSSSSAGPYPWDSPIHPILSSFPTRRSSDLIFDVDSASEYTVESEGVRSPVHRRARSEEHTSELQSRRELVCRLLLEKKITHRGVEHGHAKLGRAVDRADGLVIVGRPVSLGQ